MIRKPKFRCQRIQWQSLFLASAVVNAFVAVGQVSQEWQASWGYLILGRVVDYKKTSSSTLIEEYSYTVDVVCDYRGHIKGGARITINGPRQMVGSEIIQIPVMARGTYFISPIKPTEDSTVFRYSLPFSADSWSPIGVSLPAAVSEDEVAHAKSALLKLGELSAMGNSSGRVDVGSDKDEGNYYLWALTISIASRNASPENARSLLETLGTGVAKARTLSPDIRAEQTIPKDGPKVSLQQAIWIVHCLEEVVPQSARPPRNDVQDALMRYLQRLCVAKESESFVP